MVEVKRNRHYFNTDIAKMVFFMSLVSFDIFDIIEERSCALRILPATESDICSIKNLVDNHRAEFGFIPRAAFQEAVPKKWILVAKGWDTLLGFVRFRHRRDRITSIYELLVEKSARRKGVGTLLVHSLADNARALGQREIVLKCPIELSANDFYSAIGFHLVEVHKGRVRNLNVWKLIL